MSEKIRRSARTRWWIVWTLFFSTVTNYISRQTFAVLAPMLAVQYHFSHADLAKILGAFQISYALTWLLGGIFLDAVGTRLGLALAVTFWSVVNIFTGFASSVFSFAAFRFLLGIGKASIGLAQARPLPSGSLAKNEAWPLLFLIAAPVSVEHWQQSLFHGSRLPLAGAGRLCFQGPLGLFGW